MAAYNRLKHAQQPLAPLSTFACMQIKLVTDMQQASRQLCHRQLTWFRDDAMYHWLDATRPAEELLRHIQQELQKPQHEGTQVLSSSQPLHI